MPTVTFVFHIPAFDNLPLLSFYVKLVIVKQQSDPVKQKNRGYPEDFLPQVDKRVLPHGRNAENKHGDADDVADFGKSDPAKVKSHQGKD